MHLSMTDYPRKKSRLSENSTLMARLAHTDILVPRWRTRWWSAREHNLDVWKQRCEMQLGRTMSLVSLDLRRYGDPSTGFGLGFRY
jgi:aspartyl/asparaginyl-tRNA synthetase